MVFEEQPHRPITVVHAVKVDYFGNRLDQNILMFRWRPRWIDNLNDARAELAARRNGKHTASWRKSSVKQNEKELGSEAEK